MAAANRPLTSAQAAKLAAAVRYLQNRRPEQALALARELALEAPRSADVQQLVGMSLSDLGAAAEAATAFHRAFALAPEKAAVALNYASFLKRTGRLREAAAVLAQAPESAQTKTEQGLLALQRQDHPLALGAFRRAVALDPRAVTAWHGLGNALRRLDDLEGAEQAFRQVVRLSPGYALGWINLGAVLRLLGRVDEAASCLDRAQRLGYDGPELRDAQNGALADLGRFEEALSGARALVASHPEYVPGHETLVRLLWEHGAQLAPGADPLDRLRAALRARPGHRALGLKYLQLLLSAGRHAEALGMAAALQKSAPEDPLLDWYTAEALDGLGEPEKAGALYEKVHRALGGVNVAFLNAHARHAFRAGKPERAASCAEAALRLSPRDQQAWANLGTAWRLADDPREHWLCDYERLIGFVEIEPPPGFADLPTFLTALGGTLDALHRADRQPIGQSVRQGTQTAGRLFGRPDALIGAAQTALHKAVERWLSTLSDDPRHPFLSGRQRRLRMVGSWSVKLSASGYHANHIHPEGWMSSAFYVALPPSVQRVDRSDHAGWIQFGQPLAELGLALAPRRLLQPKPGFLALFPSYIWHGTVPFQDAASRLTIAFDLRAQHDA